MSEEKKLFSNEQVIRLLIGMFLIGAAWARLEYKIDKKFDETRSMFREYVIANDAEKKAMMVQMATLKDQLDINTMTIKAIADFIKPDEVERKYYRK